MISGIDLNATVDYILKNDTENPTVWKLGIIPSNLLAKASHMADEIDKVFTLFRLGIKGWTNLNGVEYKTEKLTLFNQELDLIPLEMLNKIPLIALSEVVVEIIKVNKISEPERKN